MTDHIPPKLLLARPYPNNLPTVPACRRCNASFQADDEYTRFVISIDVRTAAQRTAQSNILAHSALTPKARSRGLRGGIFRIKLRTL